MNASPFLVALVNLLLVGVLGALVWVVTWSLFGDRDWKTPRCPRCRHDLRGSDGLRCPECGHAAHSRKSLHGRRRRWWLALLALTTMVVLAFVLRTFWSRTSWTSAVPSTVALWMLPWSTPTGPTGDLLDELGDRLVRGELSESEIAALLDSIITGDPRAPVGSAAWLGKYGRILDRWTNVGRRAFVESAPSPERTALAEAFDRKLQRIPPIVACDLPARGIAAEPLPMELVVERRWAVEKPMRVRVDSLTLGGAPVKLLPPIDAPISIAHGRPVAARVPLLFEPLPAGTHAGSMRVTVEAGGDGAWADVATLDIPIAGLRVDERLASDFPGVSDPEIDEAIREFLRPGLIRWAKGQRRFAMRLNPTPELRERLGDVAVGVEAEVLEDGVPRRRLRLWWPGDGRIRFEPALENAEALARAKDGDERWTLRVRGVRDLAVRAALLDRSTDRPRWWNGVVTIPLRVVDDEGESSPRAWVIPMPALTPSGSEPRAPQVPPESRRPEGN